MLYIVTLYNIYFWLRFIFIYLKSLKRKLKPFFWVQNHPLCSSDVNSQMLLWSQKAGVKMFVLKLSRIQNPLHISFVTDLVCNTILKVRISLQTTQIIFLSLVSYYTFNPNQKWCENSPYRIDIQLFYLHNYSQKDLRYYTCLSS